MALHTLCRLLKCKGRRFSSQVQRMVLVYIRPSSSPRWARTSWYTAGEHLWGSL